MGRGLAVLRLGMVWGLSIPFWSILLAIHFLLLKRTPSALLARSIRFWGRASLGILGIRLVLETESTLAGRAPRVAVNNHQSGLDLLWAAAICPEAPLGIGKRELIWFPMLNLIWWGLDFIRVDRSNTEKAVASLDGVAEAINRGRRTFMVAPEGTRTPDGSLLPFKKGAFHIAIAAQAPIYPILVDGAFQLLPRSDWIPRPGTLRLRFLPPIETRGLTLADKDALRDRVQAVMAEALAEMRRQSLK